MAPSGGSPFNFNESAPARSRQAPVAYVPVAQYRHPLGLPRGSVRALLTFMILGIFWTLLLLPRREPEVHVPLYLYFLMFLVLGHYFVARSYAPAPAADGESHPLWLPRGSIRFLILLGFAVVIGYAYSRDPKLLLARLQPAGPLDALEGQPEALYSQPYLPLVLVGAFFLGVVVSRIGHVLLAGPQGLPAWFQDVQAWVSLLAILGLSAEVILQLVIKVNLTEVNLYLPHWEAVLTGIVAFYFGARS